MERLDLSSYAKDIKSNYNAVVQGEHSYAVFTTGKDSALKPTSLGDGDINDFVSEFDEGAVQFGVIAVNPFGSDVKKLVLLGWCPDSAPLKSKVSYATNFSEVGKVMHYHVDFTARDTDDLDVDEIIKKVSSASGARYSIQSLGPQKSVSSGVKPKPKSASPAPIVAESKPVPQVIKPKPSLPSKKNVKADNHDEWDGEEEIETRDFQKKPLDTLPSAYKPTKVDINALRSETESKTVSFNPSGGITSLPKPKPTGSVLNRFSVPDVVKADFGTSAPKYNNQPEKDSSKLVGGLSRNFGATSGLTPAQEWAAKKGKFTNVPKDDKPVNAETSGNVLNEDDLTVNDAKHKFESLALESAEDHQETKSAVFPPPAKEVSKPSVFPPPTKEKVKSNVFPPPVKEEAKANAFPPPPAREESKASAFPPPPQRSVPTVAPASNEWSDEDEEEKDEHADEAAEEEEQERAVPPPPSNTNISSSSFNTAHTTSEPVKSTTETTGASPEEGLPSAIAEYDYEKDEENEIGFTEGETIIDIKFVDEDWWIGTNSKGENGLFPATYVTITEKSFSSGLPAAEEDDDVPAPTLPSRERQKPEELSSGLSAVAEYDYEASEDNELTFAEGDVITNIEKVDEDWWLGEFNGEKKLFPANYVTLQ